MMAALDTAVGRVIAALKSKVMTIDSSIVSEAIVNCDLIREKEK